MKNEERKTEWWDYDGKLFNFRPCLFVFLFLCLGIFYAFCVVAYGASAWWTLLLLPVFAAAYFILRNKKTLIAICFLALAFLVGGLSYSNKVQNYLSSPALQGEFGVHGRVVSAQYYEGKTQVILSDIKIDGVAYEGKLIAYLVWLDEEDIKVGDVIFTEGMVWTERELSNEFGASFFADDIRYALRSENTVQVISSKFAPFAFIRDHLRHRLYSGMDEETASLVFAILTGDSSGIETGLLENVRAGGIAHIFAVSGLHIGTLYGACSMLAQRIKPLRKRKLVRAIAISALLVGYGAICGFRESVVRALIGCIVAEFCQLIGVKRDMTETLSIAGIFILLANPASLFCVGFQLSFLACFGIALLAKPIQVWLERIFRRVTKDQEGEENKKYPIGYSRGIRGKIFSFLSVTVSVQLATAPVLYSAFGYLSCWGLLLNCLLVPCVAMIFPITLAFCVVACLLPTVLSRVVLFFPNVLWTVVVLVFQTLDFSSVIEGGAITFGMAVSYYGALLVLSDKFNLTQSKKTVGFLAFATSFLLGMFLF